MKEYFEFDRSKLVLKIFLIIVMLGLYSYFFIDKLYMINNDVSIIRMLMPFILICLFSFGLFYKPKIKLSSKKSLFFSIIISIFFIIFNLFIIQYAQGFSLFNIFKFNSVVLSTFFILLNLGILTILFLILFSISNSFKISIIGLNIITVLFALAEYYVIQFRGVGFLAVDIMNIKTAMNVAGSYSYSLNYNVYITIIIMISLVPFILYLNKNTYFKGKKRLIPIVLTVLLILALIFGMNITKVDKKTKVKYFKPQETFEKKGLPISFVRSMKDLIVVKPDDYSKDNIEKIMKNYKSDKKENKEGPNIIIIMDEAFTDFTEITDLKISEDYVPFIHSLKEDTIKGNFYTSVFGGGTSSTEFEVLTSNTSAFTPYGTNAYRAYINSSFPNLTTTLKDLGYSGLIAMHPYKPSGYSRDKVYPLLGFNKFISLNDFDKNTEKYGRFISDKGDFDKIINEYEKSKKENKGPFYLFNVTMQNHSPFTGPGVSDSIKLKYDQNYPEASQYMNQIKYTDEAVEKIVSYFKKQDDKTIIVFFGDHEPKLESEFYEEVMKTYNKGEELFNLKKNNSQFFIWANYDIKEETDVKISANYMSSLILDIADLPKTGYNKYTESVRKEIPIITKKGYIGKDGKFYKVDDKKSPYYKTIKNYNIVEYNNLFDSKNRINKYFYLTK